jgi:hypothetical protein
VPASWRCFNRAPRKGGNGRVVSTPRREKNGGNSSVPLFGRLAPNLMPSDANSGLPDAALWIPGLSAVTGPLISECAFTVWKVDGKFGCRT